MLQRHVAVGGTEERPIYLSKRYQPSSNQGPRANTPKCMRAIVRTERQHEVELREIGTATASVLLV